MMLLHVLSFLCLSLSGCKGGGNVIVASYNLWNIMHQWEVRKFYIADMMQDVNADIIGFRDVRAKSNLKHTQLDELQQIAPEYEYKYFLPIRRINEKHFKPGWEWEGVGFLSRHKILMAASANFTIPYDSPDKRRRSLFHLQFLIEPEQLEINIVLVELSYHKITQCSEAYQIVKYIYSIGVESVVIIGDFHVDENFNVPLKAIANGVFEPDSLCRDIGKVFDQEQYQSHQYKFLDAWVEKNPNRNGFTYSNLPIPGFTARPDRILVSSVGLKTKASFVVGKGGFYGRKYGHQLHMNRYYSVLQAAKEGSRLNEKHNSTCFTSCGPQASCRCGICISSEENESCSPGECSECSASKLLIFNIIIFIFISCAVYIAMFFLLLFLGISKPRWRRFLNSKLRMRRFSSLVAFFAVTSVLLCLLVYSKIQFEDVMRLVSNQPIAELYPSNHLMVVAKLEIV